MLRLIARPGDWMLRHPGWTIAFIIAVTVIGLTGCATGPKVDVIVFDRGAFALMFGRLSQSLAIACNDGKLSEADCARLKEVDASVSKQIMTPPATTPSGIDAEQLMKILGVAAKLAI